MNELTAKLGQLKDFEQRIYKAVKANQEIAETIARLFPISVEAQEQLKAANELRTALEIHCEEQERKKEESTKSGDSEAVAEEKPTHEGD